MALNMRPWLDERPSHGPNDKVSHVGQILLIAVAVALAGFLAALITGILTAGGS